MQKKKVIVIAVVCVVLAAALLVYFFLRTSMKQSIKKNPSGEDSAAVSETDAASKPAGGRQSPTSGGMPGMPGIEGPQGRPEKKMEQAPAEATAEVPTVEIPPEKQQLIGVKIATVSVKPLVKTIRTVGRIQYDETKLATVNTKVEGWIEKLYVNVTGQYVRKGDLLAEVYSPELFATQREFLNVLKWGREKNTGTDSGKMVLKDAEEIVQAARQRLRLWDISDEQIRKIEETGQPVKTLAIYSPVSGYIVQKMAIQGMKTMPGEKLFDVVDLSTLWVIADIYEYDLPLIRIGEQAVITLGYLPGREFSSRMDYVYPVLSAETRTAKVRFTIGNADGNLKPQMFTNVMIEINMGGRLAVPESAVIETGTRQVVYVDKGEGIFEPREVLTGIRAAGLVEVLKGLKAGERVATSANFLIDSEAQLKGVQPLHSH